MSCENVRNIRKLILKFKNSLHILKVKWEDQWPGSWENWNLILCLALACDWVGVWLAFNFKARTQLLLVGFLGGLDQTDPGLRDKHLTLWKALQAFDLCRHLERKFGCAYSLRDRNVGERAFYVTSNIVENLLLIIPLIRLVPLKISFWK